MQISKIEKTKTKQNTIQDFHLSETELVFLESKQIVAELWVPLVRQLIFCKRNSIEIFLLFSNSESVYAKSTVLTNVII